MTCNDSLDPLYARGVRIPFVVEFANALEQESFSTLFPAFDIQHWEYVRSGAMDDVLRWVRSMKMESDGPYSEYYMGAATYGTSATIDVSIDASVEALIQALQQTMPNERRDEIRVVGGPTHAPTDTPTKAPTNTPTTPTKAPTNTPTPPPPPTPPTNTPTTPTKAPTNAPTNTPTNAPTTSPTNAFACHTDTEGEERRNTTTKKVLTHCINRRNRALHDERCKYNGTMCVERVDTRVRVGKLPNILFIVADDMGWDDVGYHSAADLEQKSRKTPTIDALAAEGLKLEHHYAQSVCSPTRASLLTGRFVPHHGVGECVIKPCFGGGVSTKFPWFAEVLKNRTSYRTHFIGKTHLGTAKTNYLPHERGFDTFLGTTHGEADYFSHIRCAHKRCVDGGVVESMYGSTLVEWQGDNGLVYITNNDTYDNVLIENEVERLLGEHVAHHLEKPMLLYIAFRTPHEGYHASVQNETVTISVGNDKQAIYFNQYVDENNDRQHVPTNTNTKGMKAAFRHMMGNMDDTINYVKERFKHHDLWNNTILVFTGDNGAITLRPSGSNKPFKRGGKKTFYEGGIRVPAFVRGVNNPESPYARHRHAGLKSHKLMHVADWYKTVLHWAGLSFCHPDLDVGCTSGYKDLLTLPEHTHGGLDSIDQDSAIFGEDFLGDECPVHGDECYYEIRDRILFATDPDCIEEGCGVIRYREYKWMSNKGYDKNYNWNQNNDKMNVRNTDSETCYKIDPMKQDDPERTQLKPKERKKGLIPLPCIPARDLLKLYNTVVSEDSEYYYGDLVRDVSSTSQVGQHLNDTPHNIAENYLGPGDGCTLFNPHDRKDIEFVRRKNSEAYWTVGWLDNSTSVDEDLCNVLQTGNNTSPSYCPPIEIRTEPLQ